MFDKQTWWLRTSEWVSNRELRGEMLLSWVERVFGGKSARPFERALRVVEEVVELAQAEGIPRERVHQIVDYVYGRPAGEWVSEAGAVGLTLLAYCRSRGVSADLVEVVETQRAFSMSETVLAGRHEQKVMAGIAGPRL